MNNNRTKLSLTAVAVAVSVAACSGLPDRIPELESARSEVSALDSDPMVGEAASTELREARDYLQDAERAYAEGRDLDVIKHRAYLAERQAEVGQQLIASAKLQEDIEKAQLEENRVLLQAREREAARAENRAEFANLRATRSERESQRLERESQQLKKQLEELQAKETERGLVLTLGDVLFDTDKAELKAGAQQTIDRLAAFMKENPEREVLIEGHTDSRGSDEYNRELSQRRADAVRNALNDEGIDSSRIRTKGLGEEYAVASNDTAAGRQENRRVEVVISDKNGRFPTAAVRD